ncbi:hypothetical protein WOLCODRAFT_137932 [Wolfiporia cocos MD-104 SS10]|uniref:Uncharacterized protein n=1 Tax=Wolfiporia cocos (strain MD-104) TaxID=742152 RepID=A0A2H3JKT7_WOLCO|nr:hypothetical protein WOLCODRAFT_137932 [Wolfiporia cocos MD-104 SS10]
MSLQLCQHSRRKPMNNDALSADPYIMISTAPPQHFASQDTTACRDVCRIDPGLYLLLGGSAQPQVGQEQVPPLA